MTESRHQWSAEDESVCTPRCCHSGVAFSRHEHPRGRVRMDAVTNEPIGSQPPERPSLLGRSERAESFFDQIGGTEAFERLVDAFYEGVAADPLLRPMYPEEDLAGANERL